MSGETIARRRRRLRDRLPVRLRHHWKPAATLGVGLAAMVWFLGDARISPYVTSSSRVEADAITDDVRGTVGLYDTSARHSVQLTYQQTDFDKMMKEFKEDGTKDYIEADLTIDGVYLNDVGIRLKGNSTLSSLRGNKGMPGGGRAAPEGAQGAPAGAPGGAGGRDRGQAQKAGGAPGGAGGEDAGKDGAAGGAGMGGGMVQYDLSAEKPEELPLLVKIDEYVEGRAYQGEREISLRPGSSGQAPLNEALALSLTKESGQKAERYAFTEVKVNNRPAATRLMVEAPDTDYADDIADGNGVLYKARANGSFDYRGDDPSDYESSFKQRNKKGSQDLEPVMKFIKWVNSASDEEFAKDLDQYVDVDTLAEYVASQNLLLNFDDMAGPGKNYLLWYDLDTKKFSVLGWDYNLTFSGDATAGPDDSIGMGGMGGGMGAGMPSQMPSELPSGMPGGAPGGQNGGAGGEGGEDGDAAKGRMGGGMQHVLKTKFLDADAYAGVYQKAYRELYQQFYGSGTAAKDLKDIAEQARSAGADSKALDTAVTKLEKTVTDRTAALAKEKKVTG
ncbi:CotH kinase family protein [Streptomyces kunmingensis]|uniref:CotH kinase family protein n=1 Tax=Streptomyces kunmingensis TaxID=68225 RepID=A0ABU6C7D0_9ACTN|nr:CotH kinase family protein [Streptomyces kunmingensis]MEB3960594.1 CotH kinase family protein [Streptomyces kunmingensis]